MKEKIISTPTLPPSHTPCRNFLQILQDKNLCVIIPPHIRKNAQAEMAKLADAPDLGSGAARHGGSSPLFRTTQITPSNQTSINLTNL